VLAGAFSNRWNLELGRELRFSFKMRDRFKLITDRARPGRAWRTEMDPSGQTRTGKPDEQVECSATAFVILCEVRLEAARCGLPLRGVQGRDGPAPQRTPAVE
jgi:hypothetical protein